MVTTAPYTDGNGRLQQSDTHPRTGRRDLTAQGTTTMIMPSNQTSDGIDAPLQGAADGRGDAGNLLRSGSLFKRGFIVDTLFSEMRRAQGHKASRKASSMKKSVQILGIRGVPGSHGGFETFAEHLAPYLVERGWDVTVYCQVSDAESFEITEDHWQGVHRVNIPVRGDSAYSSLVFDRKSIQMAARRPDLCLVLGYNTAILTLLLRLRGHTFVTNMDGLEWKRAKWALPFRAWFYMNDWIGCLASSHLIADHPVIADHLATRTKRKKITMISYGADPITAPDPAPLSKLGLEPNGFMVSICRPEPENSVLEKVRAFSRKPRGKKLVVLGKFLDEMPYHQAVLEAASSEVLFPGAIYDKDMVHALRGHALAYCHGHTVGGTNPSLVEAMGAGNAVIAHDNPFNRWVAGDDQFFFADEDSCAAQIELALSDPERLAAAQSASIARFQSHFTWDNILGQYEALLEQFTYPNIASQAGTAL